MPQVSLYLDKLLYKELESIVKKKGVSMSSFVGGMLKEYLDDTLPDEFYKAIGSLKDDPIEVPEELPFSLDCKRKSL